MLGTGNAARLEQLSIPYNNFVILALGFAAIGLFVMLLMGGFKLITSGGDPKAAGAAKQTLTYAVVGMILIACSFLILRIIATFTGVNTITNFNIVR